MPWKCLARPRRQLTGSPVLAALFMAASRWTCWHAAIQKLWTPNWAELSTAFTSESFSGCDSPPRRPLW